SDLTLMPNGKVLITGGADLALNTTSASGEVYDPQTGKFATIGNTMSSVRASHTATLLNNGKVLLAAGVDNAALVFAPAADLYDPATNLFAATGAMVMPRYSASATTLPDMTVLIAG